MASTNYPGSLDAYPVPNNGDTISVADHWLGPAVIGIETELGTDPAGSHTNVKDRLDQVDSAMGFKNRIIGGNFSTNPWQRGTSFTGYTGATSAYTADRFVAGGNQDGSIDVLKTADAPTIAEAGIFTQHCLHANVDSEDTSIGASQYYEFYQFIEGYNILDLGFGQSGTRYVTLSFWHKHTETGTNCVSIRNGAVNRSYVVEYTQSVSNAWEKQEITIPVDTTGTYDYTNQRALQIVFTIAAGTDRQTTANAWQSGAYTATSNQVNNLETLGNDFKIALVQLEAGDKATRFETRSVGQELALCKRYYEIVPVHYGSNTSSITIKRNDYLWFEKRASPTATLTVQYFNGSWVNPASTSVNYSTMGGYVTIIGTNIQYIGHGTSQVSGIYESGKLELAAEL